MPSEAVTYRHAIARAQLVSHGRCSVTRSHQPQAPLRSKPQLQPLDLVRTKDAARQRDDGTFSSVGPLGRQQRRYASNVPGPLEARRRLAKRRMAIAVPGTSQEGNSLSGWWSDMRRLVKAAQMSLGTEIYPWENLQWSPPQATLSLSLRAQNRTSREDGKKAAGVVVNDNQSLTFAAAIERCGSLRDLTDVCTAIPTQNGRGVEASSMVLMHLLNRQAYWDERHGVGWIANLTAVLNESFFPLRENPNSFAAVMDWTNKFINCCTEQDQLRSILPLWFTALQNTAEDTARAVTWEQAALRALRENPRARESPSEVVSSDHGLAPPQEIAHCFSAFDNFTLGRVFILGALYHLPPDTGRRRRVINLYNKHATTRPSGRAADLVSSLVRSVKALDAHTLWRLWSWVYIITYKVGGERRLLELLESVQAQAPRAGWSGPPMTRLLRLLARTDPAAAMRIFRAGDFYVNDPSPIIAELMTHKHVPPRDIMYMMWHGQRAGRVRDDSVAKGCQLSTARIQLINTMALKFSARGCDSPRTAYRNVQHCYRYLVEHGAPVTKEVAEALCVSGVIRTLQAREWLSTSKFAWILGVVREAEGPEIAERLDRLTYKWREQVRMHVIEERRRRYRQGERLVSSLAWVKVPRRRFGIEIGDLRRRKGQPVEKPRFVRVPRRKLIWVPAKRQL